MKSIDYDSMEMVLKWICPYKNCGKENEDCDASESDALSCHFCKKDCKVKEPS